MLEQLPNVNTFLIQGLASPCICIILAICITGSISASGNTPFLPAHSISKLSILNGAIFCHSSSGVWLIKSSYDTSNSIWHLEVGVTASLEEAGLGFRNEYFPGGTSIQLQPTTSASIINLISYSILLSNT